MLVTKLLEMVERGRPSERLRAIEMLGKVSEVALFSPNVIVHTPKVSEDDLNRQIAEKLRRFTGISDAKVTKSGTQDDIDVV